MFEEYYLGLDIGTNSVGWAVTDCNYNICTYKKKAMWGIRLFEQAETAAERRTNRAIRRRMERRKERIDLLQELFAEEISKVDESFFIRLNESRLYLEDKTVKVKHPLFNDKNYTDVDYYKEFPTIFHLRKDLINNSESHDIRIVYLALHNIIKKRGHFLIDGGLKGAKDFQLTINTMLELVNDELDFELYISQENKNIFENILKDKNIAKSRKAKDLLNLFDLDKASLGNDEYKRQKSIIEQICKLIVGNKGDISKLFELNKEELTKVSFSFADTGYDEEIKPIVDDEVPDRSYILDSIRTYKASHYKGISNIV